MTPDRRSLLLHLERELCACCRPILRRIAQQHMGERMRIRYRDVVMPQELALALRLIDGGMSRPEARDALMVRLQASRAKAYRLLHAAIDARWRRIMPPTHTDTDGLAALALALALTEDDPQA